MLQEGISSEGITYNAGLGVLTIGMAREATTKELRDVAQELSEFATGQASRLFPFPVQRVYDPDTGDVVYVHNDDEIVRKSPFPSANFRVAAVSQGEEGDRTHGIKISVEPVRRTVNPHGVLLRFTEDLVQRVH